MILLGNGGGGGGGGLSSSSDLGGGGDGDSSEEDDDGAASDDSEIDVHRPVSPCNVVFVGANVDTGRSSLRSKSKTKKVRHLVLVLSKLVELEICFRGHHFFSLDLWGTEISRSHLLAVGVETYLFVPDQEKENRRYFPVIYARMWAA